MFGFSRALPHGRGAADREQHRQVAKAARWRLIDQHEGDLPGGGKRLGPVPSASFVIDLDKGTVASSIAIGVLPIGKITENRDLFYAALAGRVRLARLRGSLYRLYSGPAQQQP